MCDPEIYDPKICVFKNLSLHDSYFMNEHLTDDTSIKRSEIIWKLLYHWGGLHS